MAAHPLLPQSRRLVCTLTLASYFLLVVLQPALAAPARQGTPPQLPARFFGTVTLDDSPVPAGTEVRALIGGTVYAVALTTVVDAAAAYVLDVTADDPATPDVVEGGRTGDVVTFQVGSISALESGVWRAEEATELNLTAQTPAATPTFTVTPTRTLRPPARFFGTVTLDGSPVPAGTEVRALIGGTVYAVALTTVVDDAAVYVLDVPADDPATPNVVEGGQTGDVVAFQVGSVYALEPGVWRAEEATELNLTAQTPTATPTLTVTPTRTPRSPVTIPEPGTLALFASGLAGLFAMAAGVATRHR